MLLADRHRSRRFAPSSGLDRPFQPGDFPIRSDLDAAEMLDLGSEPQRATDQALRFEEPRIEDLFSDPARLPRETAPSYRRRWIGRLLMGPQADPQRRISLNPYRARRGAAVDAPFVRMEPAKGRDPAPMGYRTKVSEAAMKALQSAFNGGASEAELFEVAGRFGVRLQLAQVRDAVNARDQRRAPVKFKPDPDTTPPPVPMRPWESMSEYVDRVQGGHFEWTGPYTPSHPTGRNTAERIQAIFQQFLEPEQAEHYSNGVLTLIAPLGAMQAGEDAWAAAKSGRPGAAAGNTVLAVTNLFPPLRVARAELQIIDAAALAKASARAESSVDLAQAVRSAVDDGLARGGTVTFRSGRISRSIVRTDESGGLVDASGKAWSLPGPGERVEIRAPRTGEVGQPARNSVSSSPPDPGSGTKVRLTGTSGLLGGPKSSSRLGFDAGPAPYPLTTPLCIDLRPASARGRESIRSSLGDERAGYDPDLLWDERFANLRYAFPEIIRSRIGEEIIASLGRGSAANLAFQRIVWPTLVPAAIDRSFSGSALTGLMQMFRPDQLERRGFPLSSEFLAATGNIQDVLEAAARQHPDQLPRFRDLAQITIPDSQLDLPRLNRKAAAPMRGVPGEFSLADQDYPSEYVWLPDEPLRLVPDEEYRRSLQLKQSLNRRIHSALGTGGGGYEIHEPHTIKFAGDAESFRNRILLRADVHRAIINPYWLRMQAYLNRYGRLR